MDLLIDMDIQEIDETRQLIDSLDLNPIIERMIKVCNWSRKQAELASQQYRNFLYLKKKYGSENTLPPSVDIDEFWHNHILHTKKYFEDCLTIFGEFLHHHPHHGSENILSHSELESLFNNETQMLYFKEFGEYLYEIRKNYFIKSLNNIINCFI